MATPNLVMFNVPLNEEQALRWGARTPQGFMVDATADPATELEDGLRIFQVTRSRATSLWGDVEDPARVCLANTAYELLHTRTFKRKLGHLGHDARHPRQHRYWFLWEAKNRLRPLPAEDVQRASDAIVAYSSHVHGPGAPPFPASLVAITADENALADPGAFIDRLVQRVKLVAAPPRVARGRGVAPTLVIATAAEDGDAAEVRAFREVLLALGWPDSKTVGRQLGSTDAGAEARASRERAAGNVFAVWAGRDRGGYRHPTFQFLRSGSPHARLPELLDALARQPDLTATADPHGWERAFWLYTPRGRLSEQALALRAAAPTQVRADPARFAALSDAARAPADVFAQEPQAVIDLARDDAADHAPSPAEPAHG